MTPRRSRLRCHACHIQGAEAPEEITVLAVHTGPDGVKRYSLICDKCGHRWSSDSQDCEYLPSIRQADRTQAENVVPSWYMR